MECGGSLTVGPAFVCVHKLTGTPNLVQPPDHSTPGTHTHAHARVHMARACSRALGAHWYPGVAEHAHTHTHMQTASSFYSRSPVIKHKQNSHSPSRPHVPRRVPGGTRAPLTFPPLNPTRSRGQLPGEGWRGDPRLGPPLCSRSCWSWGRWPSATARSGSGAGTQGPTLPSSGAYNPGRGCSPCQIPGRPGTQRKAPWRVSVRMSAEDSEGLRKTIGRVRGDTACRPVCSWQLPKAGPERDSTTRHLAGDKMSPVEIRDLFWES